MCLIINDEKHTLNTITWRFEPIIAEEDIEVFKILKVSDVGKIGNDTSEYIKNSVKTPYTNTVIDFNEQGVCTMPMINEDDFYKCKMFRIKSIGAYHSWTTEYDAKRDYAFLLIYDNPNIYKAVIPRGSLVYYGMTGDICSNQLIIKQEIIPVCI